MCRVKRRGVITDFTHRVGLRNSYCNGFCLMCRVEKVPGTFSTALVIWWYDDIIIIPSYRTKVTFVVFCNLCFNAAGDDPLSLFNALLFKWIQKIASMSLLIWLKFIFTKKPSQIGKHYYWYAVMTIKYDITTQYSVYHAVEVVLVF